MASKLFVVFLALAVLATVTLAAPQGAAQGSQKGKLSYDTLNMKIDLRSVIFLAGQAGAQGAQAMADVAKGMSTGAGSAGSGMAKAGSSGAKGAAGGR